MLKMMVRRPRSSGETENSWREIPGGKTLPKRSSVSGAKKSAVPVVEKKNLSGDCLAAIANSGNNFESEV